MANKVVVARSSRDVWSPGGGRQLRDLLSSALATLLLGSVGRRPAYFSSPWISDFALFENRFMEYSALFPDLEDANEIRLSAFLVRLAKLIPVRVLTTRREVSEAFISRLAESGSPGMSWRFAEPEYHEKGILAPAFYIEGSMNITFHGVNINGEKITYHAASNEAGAAKIATAYLEFDRRWERLPEVR